MPRIHVLPQSVISAIAAGEVAERPATIIKELIENAVDAQATDISIYLEKSGQQKIVVSDNGSGMDKADLALSIQRHTTSKIRTADDLLHVQTFGFRGEALASVGSVSNLTIQTKTAKQTVGQELVMRFGKVLSQKPVAAVQGTTVAIDGLFANTPARLKFLKKPLTELRLIIDAITNAALSHPEISFRLTQEKKILIDVPAGQDLALRLESLFGSETASLFIPFQFGETRFQVSGLLGAPQLARQTKTQQFLFVNHRPVTHQQLSQTLKDAYGSLLAPRQQPIFILQLHLPATAVDVNVHPRKETVKFLDEKQLLQFIQTSVQECLAKTNLMYRASAPDTWKLQEPTPQYQAFSRQASAETHQLLSETTEPWKFSETLAQTPIFQLHHTYLVMQTPEGLLLIDQHAAHERILYEQYLAALKKNSETAQSLELAKPVILRFSPSEFQLLQNNFEMLQKVGFSIEPFGKQSVRVTHLPQNLHDRNLQKLFAEFLDDLTQEKPIKTADTLAHRTLAYLACRNAIQAGDPLAAEQRQELLKKLLETPNHFTCPHGRPTMFTWTIADLEKMFRRH